jgi:thioredoxin reductase
MAVDTPARIAILGAGPIGLEAALYARFLGYDVDIYDRGRVCEHIRRWAHVRMFSPFGLNASPLGIAALVAQEPTWRAPAADALLTGGEFLEQYLLPLAASDLIEDYLHLETEVLAVAKTEALKGELFQQEERGDEDFRLLLRDKAGVERYAEADVVIDATGVFGQPNSLGAGGLPALGERELASEMERGLPDVHGTDRVRFAEKHVAVIGDGFSAATNVIALTELAKRYRQTRITWITRYSGHGEGPMRRIANDPLAERDRVAITANALANSDQVTWLPERVVSSVNRSNDGGAWTLQLAGSAVQELSVDQVIANVGCHPDNAIYRELQIDECPATGGPARLSSVLTAQGAVDCLSVTAGGPEALLTSEPNFYVLGAKSYGRRSNFLLLNGIRQVRDLFKIIGDRDSLDLYKTIGGVQL